MKVVKTITCHNVYNHGATLQEYALLKYLRDIGYDASSINYKPDYLSKHYDFWMIGNPKFNYPILKQLYLLSKLPGRLKSLKRKEKFDAFESKHIVCDNTLYKSNEELKKNPPKADAYICGSDQIWNHLYNNGKDPAFYLDFAPEQTKRISYAASLATNHIPIDLVNFYKKNLSRFNHISVRETSTKKILNNIGFNNVTHVLDPVFLINKNDWINDFVIKHDEEDYIFVYDFDSNPEIKKTTLYLKKVFSSRVKTVNRDLKYADENLWEKDPSAFLTLIANSKYVITNSFHATCFALIFEKPFLVFNREENINARMSDLLQLLGLENNLINKTDNEDLSKYEIDYKRITPIKNNLIYEFKKFLLNSLSS